MDTPRVHGGAIALLIFDAAALTLSAAHFPMTDTQRAIHVVLSVLSVAIALSMFYRWWQREDEKMDS